MKSKAVMVVRKAKAPASLKKHIELSEGESEEEKKQEEIESEESSQEESGVMRAMKGKAPASKKKKAESESEEESDAEGSDEETGESESENEEGKEQKNIEEGKAKLQDMKGAYKDVGKKQGFLRKLERDREKLLLKMKANQKMTRVAQKELDELKSTAANKRRGITRVKDEKVKRMLLGRMGRAMSGRAKAKANASSAASRARKTQKVLKAAKDKATPFRLVMERAQARLKAAEKQCKELRAQGEEVPAEGEKDFAAAGAWKPPGLRAAKERAEARVAHAKAEANWKKVNVVVVAKEEKNKAAKDKLLGAKGNETSAEERTSELKGSMKSRTMKAKSATRKAMKATKSKHN